MKKHIILLVSVFLALQSSAQYDSVFHKAVIIKVNPTLLISYLLGQGELGGGIQYDFNPKYSVFAGIGIDNTTPLNQPINIESNYPIKISYGYTLRAGVYLFLKKHRYFSLQIFYREWLNTNVYNYDYGLGNNVGGAGSTDANINSLFSDITASYNSARQYYIDKCSLSVLDFDVIYGRQISKRVHQKLLFEWFVGAGVRLKTIFTQEIGDFDQNFRVLYPVNSPTYFTNSIVTPDLKLGILLGFKL